MADNEATRPIVKIYADGACSGNPGPGGWGAVLRAPVAGTEKRLSGGEKSTTNNRMELMAVISALEALKVSCLVEVITDSRYVADAFRLDWIGKWRRNGWKTASKQPVKNIELWERLLAAAEPHQVTWTWVRGHAGHPENELADRLAVAARLEIGEKGP